MTSRPLHFPIPASLLAVLALSLSPAAALADGELVSRADGPNGEPFYGSLLGVSQDGQSVLLNGPGTLAGLTDETTTTFIRDRTTDTLEPVLKGDGAAGTVHPFSQFPDGTSWFPLSISEDGDRVLIRAPRTGDNWGPLVVRDVTTDTTKTVSTLPDGSTTQSSFGVFVDGGKSVLYTAVSSTGTDPAIYRRDVDGGTAQLLKAGAWLTGATRDGSTFTWKRDLPTVTPPAGTVPQLPSSDGTAVGYTTVGGASRVVERTKKTIRANQAPYPYCSQGVTEGSSPRDLLIDAAGRHLWWGRATTYAISPEQHIGYVERDSQLTDGAANGLPIGGMGYYLPQIKQLGATGDFALVRQDVRSGPWAFFGPVAASGATPWTPPSRGATPEPEHTTTGYTFAQDTGYVAEEVSTPVDGVRTYSILAFDPTGPVPAPAPVLAPKANATDLPDDPSLKPDITFQGCAKPTSAIFDVKLATPVTTSKPAGTVTVDRTNAAPVKITLTVKTAGFSTWTKTLTGAQMSQPTTLPRPAWLLPQTVKVTASFERSGEIAPSSVSTSRSWTAWK